MHHWTEQEIEFLRHSRHLPYEVIAKRLGLPQKVVKHRCNALGLTRKPQRMRIYKRARFRKVEQDDIWERVAKGV